MTQIVVGRGMIVFLPVADQNSSDSRLPWLTSVLLVLLAVVYLWQLWHPDTVIRDYGLIPAQWQQQPATLVTALFLHAAWLHLILNLLFLWVFGGNVERWMGSLAFILFYLAAGVLAGLLVVCLRPDDSMPYIGASGSISALIGCYAVLFPRHSILTMVWPLPPLFFALPVFVFVGLWLLLQVIFAWKYADGSIAYIAHFGGFLTGLAVGVVCVFTRHWRDS